jgi:hypothetical protein
MDIVLTSFIRALRNADVPVSTSETLDAFTTVQLIGDDDRTKLKQALSLVLPKTLDEKMAFEVCFDRFFLYDRSRRVIWLNPEPRSIWNTGIRRCATSPRTATRSRSAARSHRWRDSSAGCCEAPGEDSGTSFGYRATQGRPPELRLIASRWTPRWSAASRRSSPARSSRRYRSGSPGPPACSTPGPVFQTASRTLRPREVAWLPCRRGH